MTNQRGFSLIEALFAVGMMAMLMFMAAVALQPLQQLKHGIESVAGLHMISTHMRDCINHELSWDATIADPLNTSMVCLRNHTPCTVAAIYPPNNSIRLKSFNTLTGKVDDCLVGYDTRFGFTNKGFTKEGEVCTGFNALGNPICPFRYDVQWTAVCSDGAPSCANPIIQIRGDMVVGATDHVSAKHMDLTRYTLRALRGRADINRYFVLSEEDTGSCSKLGVFRRLKVLLDPGNYVKNLSPAGVFTLDKGRYVCNISVPGYLTGGHKANLALATNINSTLLAGTTEFSPNYSSYTQTRSLIAGILDLKTSTRMGVAHFCSVLPPEISTQAQTLGVPMASGPAAFTILACSVLPGGP